MTFTSSSFRSAGDGIEIATYTWDQVENPRGVVQVAHGLAEHAARYDRLATALNAAGFVVHATDHRGHGRSITETPGDFGAPGFDGLAADVVEYGEQLGQSHPELPLFILGHSMGSFATQLLLLDHSHLYAGAVLSGSTTLDVMAAGMADAPADGPQGLEAFNVGFEHRTGYEWLSRDEAEVDAYVADELCGFETPAETIPALFGIAGRVANPTTVRPDLPILIASGSADPLARGGQLVELLGQRYRDAGVQDVTVIVYPDARHEIFNETNRDQVTEDVIAWLEAHIPRG